jgi:hypothetical protein
MAVFDDPVMDLQPQYYSAIGEFLFRYAQLEYQMHEMIWFALGLDYKRGRLLTIGSGTRTLRGMIGTITSTDRWVASKTTKQLMNSIASTAKKHFRLRNALAHGSWQAPNGDPKRARLHFMKEAHERLLPRFNPALDSRAIHKAAGELMSANHKARKLIASLSVERR